MHLHHLQGVLTLYCAKVIKLFKLQLNKISRLKCSCHCYWMIKKICKKLIITTYGSYLFGGCIYSLDSLVGVIPILVFPVCWGDEKVKTPWRWCKCIEICRSAYDVQNIVNIYGAHWLVLDNKLYKMHGTYNKIVQLSLNGTPSDIDWLP